MLKFKSKNLLTALVVTLLAGTAQLSNAHGWGDGRGPGRGPGRPGPGRPDRPRDDDRRDRFAVRQAYDLLGRALFAVDRYDFRRSEQAASDALYELQSIRGNYPVNAARQRISIIIGQLRNANPRNRDFVRNNALRALSNAQIDLRNSGLLGR